jgi:hypothetical protein
MDEPVKLTKKQQQVLKGLREGKSPQDIAKSIKATRSAVYGHMARLKEKGVALPEHGPNGDAPAASGNGRSANGGTAPRPFDVADGFALDINEVEERTRAAIEEIDARAHERLKDVQAERLTLQERLAVLQDEEGQINAAIQRAKKVEEALV